MDHLFGGFWVSKPLWDNFCRWLRLDLYDFLGSIVAWFQALEVLCLYSFKCDLLWLFGLAFCWMTWNCRNLIIFYGGMLGKFDNMSMLKLVSWEWFLVRNKVGVYTSWSDWNIFPSLYIVYFLSFSLVAVFSIGVLLYWWVVHPVCHYLIHILLIKNPVIWNPKAKVHLSLHFTQCLVYENLANLKYQYAAKSY